MWQFCCDRGLTFSEVEAKFDDEHLTNFFASYLLSGMKFHSDRPQSTAEMRQNLGFK